MVKNHKDFEQISDNTVIWRYMSVDKFLWLLNNKKLHLHRIDKFDDRQEGHPSLLDKEMFASLGVAPDYLNRDRKRYFVNCWIESDHELALMWQAYAKAGVAIKSTAGLLRKSLAKDTAHTCYFSRVNYIDFKTGSSHNVGDNINIYRLIFTKRNIFRQEQELRIVHFCDKITDDEETGIDIPIDVNLLIDELWLSKDISRIGKDLIRQSIESNGLKVDITESQM